MPGIMGVQKLSSFYDMQSVHPYALIPAWLETFLTIVWTVVLYLKKRLGEEIDLITFPLKGKDMIQQAYLQARDLKYQRQ